MAVSMDLLIQATGTEVRRASEWLERCCREHNVPVESHFRIDVCMNETAANIISHSEALLPDCPIMLHLTIGKQLDRNYASLKISHEAAAFNPLTFPAIDRPQSLECAQPGGLGVAMMRAFADDITYLRKDGRNHLTFFVRWPSSCE